jgi:hypothetical protein
LALVKTGIPEVDKALKALRAELMPDVSGTYLQATLAAGTPYRFAHSLGRSWAHWFVTRSTLGSPVFEANVSTTDRGKEIWLQCASAGDLEIFLY